MKKVQRDDEDESPFYLSDSDADENISGDSAEEHQDNIDLPQPPSSFPEDHYLRSNHFKSHVDDFTNENDDEDDGENSEESEQSDDVFERNYNEDEDDDLDEDNLDIHDSLNRNVNQNHQNKKFSLDFDDENNDYDDEEGEEDEDNSPIEEILSSGQDDVRRRQFLFPGYDDDNESYEDDDENDENGTVDEDELMQHMSRDGYEYHDSEHENHARTFGFAHGLFPPVPEGYPPDYDDEDSDPRVEELDEEEGDLRHIDRIKNNDIEGMHSNLEAEKEDDFHNEKSIRISLDKKVDFRLERIPTSSDEEQDNGAENDSEDSAQNDSEEEDLPKDNIFDENIKTFNPFAEPQKNINNSNFENTLEQSNNDLQGGSLGKGISAFSSVSSRNRSQLKAPQDFHAGKETSEQPRKLEEKNVIPNRTNIINDENSRKSLFEGITAVNNSSANTQKPFVSSYTTKITKEETFSTSNITIARSEVSQTKLNEVIRPKVAPSRLSDDFKAKLESLFDRNKSSKPIQPTPVPPNDKGNINTIPLPGANSAQLSINKNDDGFIKARKSLDTFLQASLNRINAPASSKTQAVNKEEMKQNSEKNEIGKLYPVSNKSSLEKDIILPPNTPPPGYFTFSYPPLLDFQESLRKCLLDDISVKYSPNDSAKKMLQLSQEITVTNDDEFLKDLDLELLSELVEDRLAMEQDILHEIELHSIFKHRTERVLLLIEFLESRYREVDLLFDLDQPGLELFEYEVKELLRFKVDSFSFDFLVRNFGMVSNMQLLVKANKMVHILFSAQAKLKKLFFAFKEMGEIVKFLRNILCCCYIKQKDNSLIFDVGIMFSGITGFLRALRVENNSLDLERLILKNVYSNTEGEDIISQVNDLVVLVQSLSPMKTLKANNGEFLDVRSLIRPERTNLKVRRSFTEYLETTVKQLMKYNDEMETSRNFQLSSNFLWWIPDSPNDSNKELFANKSENNPKSIVLRYMVSISDELTLGRNETDNNQDDGIFFSKCFYFALKYILLDYYVLPRMKPSDLDNALSPLEACMHWVKSLCTDIFAGASSYNLFLKTIDNDLLFYPHKNITVTFGDGVILMLILNHFLGSFAPLTSIDNINKYLEKIKLPVIVGKSGIEISIVLMHVHDRFKIMQPSKNRANSSELNSFIDTHLQLHLSFRVFENIILASKANKKEAGNQQISSLTGVPEVKSDARQRTTMLRDQIGLNPHGNVVLRRAPSPPKIAHKVFNSPERSLIDFLNNVSIDTDSSEEKDNEGGRVVDGNSLDFNVELDVDSISEADENEGRNLSIEEARKKERELKEEAIEIFFNDHRQQKFTLLMKSTADEHFFRLHKIRDERARAQYDLIWNDRLLNHSNRSEFNRLHDIGKISLNDVTEVSLRQNNFISRGQGKQSGSSYIAFYSAKTTTKRPLFGMSCQSNELTEKLYVILQNYIASK